MSKCDITENDGKKADIKSGDIITSNGGMLGLGHAGIIEVREDCVVVIEVMSTPDGSVHVQERDICDFLEDYENQKREVFISRPKQPEDVTIKGWEAKLERVVNYVKDRICNRYPVWKYALDLLFHLPDVWYCSDIVWEAFKREGITLDIKLALWDASEDKATREFMFARRGDLIRRFGENNSFISAFELPMDWVDPENCMEPEYGSLNQPFKQLTILSSPYHSLPSMLSEQLWQKRLKRINESISFEFNNFNTQVLATTQGKLKSLFCKDPLCGEIEVDVKDVKLSNTEYHGGLWCHLLPEGFIVDGVKEKIEGDVNNLRKKWKCEDGCACTSIKIADFEVKHSRHLHREHVWESGTFNGNCRLTGDLEFKLNIRVYAGICHDPELAQLAEFANELQELLKKLKKIGKVIEGFTDPDEIWKRIGGVSPKALRESSSVEKPRRIKLKPREE